MGLLFMIWQRSDALRSVVQHRYVPFGLTPCSHRELVVLQLIRFRTFASNEGAIHLPNEEGPPAEIFNEDEELEEHERRLVEQPRPTTEQGVRNSPSTWEIKKYSDLRSIGRGNTFSDWDKSEIHLILSASGHSYTLSIHAVNTPFARRPLFTPHLPHNSAAHPVNVVLPINYFSIPPHSSCPQTHPVLPIYDMIKDNSPVLVGPDRRARISNICLLPSSHPPSIP